MDVPELPGFYYDPERQKYFRILPNHLAPSNSSFYTKNAVAELEASEKSNAEAALATSIAASRAHRHNRFNTFLRTTLFRELGTAGPPERVCEAVRETYARSLRREKNLRPGLDGEGGLRCFDVIQGTPGNVHQRVWEQGKTKGSGGDVDGEERSMESLTVVIGSAQGKACLSRYFVDRNGGELLRSNDSGVSVDLFSLDPITSVTFSAQGQICATSLGGHYNPKAFIFLIPNYPPHSTYSNYYNHPIDHIAPPARSIWCSTTNLPPHPSSPPSSFLPSPSNLAAAFALGTSAGLTIITPAYYGYTTASYSLPSDIFSLAYLPSPSTSPSTTHPPPTPLLTASRDGGIRIHPPSNYNTNKSAPPLIYHGSLLTHLHPHPTNPNLLLAKGPQKTALYDIRFPHPPSPSRLFKEATRAVLVYEELSDPQGYMIDEGWDVSSDGGVMAGLVKNSSGGGERGEVGLWSVNTGRRLRFRSGGEEEDGGRGKKKRGGSNRWGRGGRFVDEDGSRESENRKGGERWFVGKVPKCIKFVNVPGVGEEIWAGVGERIERFGFGKVV